MARGKKIVQFTRAFKLSCLENEISVNSLPSGHIVCDLMSRLNIQLTRDDLDCSRIAKRLWMTRLLTVVESFIFKYRFLGNLYKT